jgi:hypothetical protein
MLLRTDVGIAVVVENADREAAADPRRLQSAPGGGRHVRGRCRPGEQQLARLRVGLGEGGEAIHVREECGPLATTRSRRPSRSASRNAVPQPMRANVLAGEARPAAAGVLERDRRRRCG